MRRAPHEARVSTRVGINGFGRVGRLALRAAWGWPELSFGHINELAGDASTAAHLLTFDSIHGRWSEDVRGVMATWLGRQRDHGRLQQRCRARRGPVGRAGIEIVLECSGAFRTVGGLEAYFDQGVSKVIVAAPVKGGEPQRRRRRERSSLRPATHDLLTAASCTTNASRRWSRYARGDRDRAWVDHDAARMTNTQTSSTRRTRTCAARARQASR